MVATIVAATVAIFVLIEISIPGGVRSALLPTGDSRSPQARALIEAFHLDSSLPVRYWYWATDALSGDFGQSMLNGRDVVEILSHRLPISMQLMFVSIALTVLIGVPLGLLAAFWADRRAGHIVNAFLGLSQSVPVYVTPLFLVAVFAIWLRWLPAAGWVRIGDSFAGNLKYMVLPITALVFAEVGIVARVIRADVLRVLEQDYISAAISKGMGSRYVLFRHALRPASLGLLNVIGVNVGSLLSGALIVEVIFGIGGLGQVLFEASINRDLYVLLGLTTYAVVVHVTLGAIIDALLLAFDPRIRRK